MEDFYAIKNKGKNRRRNKITSDSLLGISKKELFGLMNSAVDKEDLLQKIENNEFDPEVTKKIELYLAKLQVEQDLDIAA